MKSFEQEFTIHPVGQGLFYSGVIKVLDQNDFTHEFKFVFDCGSISSGCIKDEAETFNERYFTDENSTLDLLVISHFDEDHVNGVETLLNGPVKIKNLVLPFLNVEERFFMILQNIIARSGKIEKDFIKTAKFILDPLRTLSNNLDDDSSIYLISSTSPQTDPPHPRENQDREIAGLEFSFNDEEEKLSNADLKSLNIISKSAHSLKIHHVKDNRTGNIHFHRKNNMIMDFHFYQRQIGTNPKNYYKKIFKIFCERYNINMNLPIDQLTDQLVKKLKSIKNATYIKAIFKEAIPKKAVDLFLSRSKILNMNTTALSMLHRNLTQSIKNNLGYALIEPEYNIDHWYRIEIVKKHENLKTEYLPIPSLPFTLLHHSLRVHNKFINAFPNCLLTSDSFILTKEEVEEFYKRYKSFWREFWLFQIPHHGSKNNANKELMARLKLPLFKFINYGIDHPRIKSYSHPHPEVMFDLFATGQSDNYLPINEFTGLTFKLKLTSLNTVGKQENHFLEEATTN